LSPHYEGAKQDTIGVAIGTSAKLPHCIGFSPVYLMENKMPLVHQFIEVVGM
jgi:hypothetical protein